MILQPAKYRAIRGWTLGNKSNMDLRRKLRARGVDCPCSFTRPYLHSLTMDQYCWRQPVARNAQGMEYFGTQCCYPLRNTSLHQNTEYMDHFIRDPQFQIGGFYSYNPPHIELMARWDYVDVLGVISLFGDIAVHEYGYRCNIVRIDALWVIRTGQIGISRDRLVTFLEETYEAKVRVIPEGVVNGFVQWVKGENIDKLVAYGEA